MVEKYARHQRPVRMVCGLKIIWVKEWWRSFLEFNDEGFDFAVGHRDPYVVA